MDVQLKELLEKINKEGVQDAEQKASEIVSGAENKAGKIVAEAEKKAEKIIADAKAEAAKAEAGGKAAITQAGRDLVLKTKTEIEKLFNSIIEGEIKDIYKGKVLEDAVVTVVKSWSKDSAAAVQLAEKDLKELESGLKSKLAAELKAGFEIKPFSGIESGFRVSEKDGSAYYNFTSEGIAEVFSALLNPKLAEIVKEAVKE